MAEASSSSAAAASRLGGDDKSPRHHAIEGDNDNDNVDLLLVRTAVERYLDENRSSTDPLSARQMRAWTLQWVPQREETADATAAAKEEGAKEVTNDNGDDDPASAASAATAATATATATTTTTTATTARLGWLLWKGEYLTVSLHVRCRYGENELHFSVRASASPSVPTTSDEIDEGERKKGDIPGPSSSTSTSSSKPSNAVRSKMLQRLSRDDYVAKIWKASDDDDDDAQRPILCEAHIVAVPDENDGACQAGRHASYEERYDTDEGIAEAIRRAVWGASSNDAMDVWEFVLQYLPVLPSAAAAAGGAASSDHTTTTATTNKESGTGSTRNPSSLSLLADRARLRLLEDAMCDACERHGDDHLVDELRIANEGDKEETHRGEEEEKDECGESDANDVNSNRCDRHGRPNSNNDSSSNNSSHVARPQQLDVAGSSRGRRRHVKQRRQRSP
jgi:hypothetical protein